MALIGEIKRAYQRAWITERVKSWLFDNGPCVQCGSYENLELDHIDQSLKTMATRHIFSLSPSNPKRISELKNCQVLCHKCHRIKSNIELFKPIKHGTRGGYSRGCRCIECTNHQKRRMKLYRI